MKYWLTLIIDCLTRLCLLFTVRVVSRTASQLSYSWFDNLCFEMRELEMCDLFWLWIIGTSQQSSKEGYKPWKWGATARYYAFSYKDHVTNEEVHAKIQQAIGPHEDLTIVKRRKLQWYGCVSRSSGLAKTILQGTVKGGRRQGRQRKRWEDNIREWTGL